MVHSCMGLSTVPVLYSDSACCATISRVLRMSSTNELGTRIPNDMKRDRYSMK